MPKAARLPHCSAIAIAIASALGLAVVCLLPTALVAATTSSMAKRSDVSALTLEQIMADPLWLGKTPQDPYWSLDSDAIYFEQERRDEQDRDLLRVTLDGTVEPVADADRSRAGSADADFDDDRQRAIFSRHGDIFLRQSGGELRQLTRTEVAETRPAFMADEQLIQFRRGDDIYLRDLRSGLEIQPADLQPIDDPADDEPGDDYLSRQQPRLLDIVRQRQEQEEKSRQLERQRRSADPLRAPEPWYLGKDIEILNASLSPAGNAMIVIVADADQDEGQRDQMPIWVTEDGYVEITDVRPKVGTSDGTGQRILLLNLATHERHDLDLATLPEIADDPLAELRRTAEAAAEQREAEQREAEQREAEQREAEREAERDAGSKSVSEAADDAGEDAANEDVGDDSGDGSTDEPRAIEVEEVEWSPDGQQVALSIHSYDNKDRWIAIASHEQPELQSVHHLRLEGWINWYFNDLLWIDDHQLAFLSEETGYSQLYALDTDSGETRALTSGDFVVSAPQLSPERDFIYFLANVEHPGHYDSYRVPTTGDPSLTRITNLGGTGPMLLSPDGRHVMRLQGDATRPPELFVVAVGPQNAEPDAEASGEARRLTHTISDQFLAVDWIEPEIITIASSHQDRPIFARYYAPRDRVRIAGADGKVAAVVFIHGAGYLQNAHGGWSVYFREYMFHNLLSAHGYAVLDMDYRGSAGYGADWRQAIYRHMGSPEVEDLADGVAWMVEQHGVDRQRVGTYGGSYGGFLTMMALFTEPDLFACGAALRPVTDWAHYNHPYTSNILNTPDIDPEAYERSSPLEFADGLEKPLLIAAPMLDDNVLFQDTVRLAQRLIELEKEDWTVAIYPVEPHGFRQPSSWLDEYRRIFKLFERHLEP